MELKFDAFVGVISEHFPTVSYEERETISSNLLGHWKSGRTLDKIERSNNIATKDIEALEAAIKHIRHASNNIASIGWQGGKALLPYARDYAKFQEKLNWFPVIGLTDSVEFVQSQLNQIAADLSNASSQIDPNAPPVFDYLGEEFSKGGRPRENGAFYLTRELASVFKSLSGNEPTIITDAHADGHRARGWFLDFVSDAFNAVQITASPEAFARKVVKERTTPDN